MVPGTSSLGVAVTASFFGIDLAWSPGNPTGACALDRHGRIVDERLLGSDQEIIGWIESRLGEHAVVAIDAPLLVPNATGRRPSENDLARAYGSRKAGPHSSNRRRLLAVHGSIRGEDLARRLSALGFGDPWSREARTQLEVFPHPALIEAFGLEERLSYKAKKGVGVPERRQGLRRLANLLDRLRDADPPLVGSSVTVPNDARGRALKAIEDRLDARVCAWVASVWATKPERIRLFGDPTGGHIAVPIGRFVPD